MDHCVASKTRSVSWAGGESVGGEADFGPSAIAKRPERVARASALMHERHHLFSPVFSSQPAATPSHQPPRQCVPHVEIAYLLLADDYPPSTPGAVAASLVKRVPLDDRRSPDGPRGAAPFQLHLGASAHLQLEGVLWHRSSARIFVIGRPPSVPTNIINPPGSLRTAHDPHPISFRHSRKPPDVYEPPLSRNHCNTTTARCQQQNPRGSIQPYSHSFFGLVSCRRAVGVWTLTTPRP